MRDFIISDKQDITRIGIEALIRKKSHDITSIFVANSRKELIDSLEAHRTAIVVLDYVLFDFRTVDELLNVGFRFKDVHWILFSDELSTDFLKQFLFNNENSSVILKSCPIEEIEMGLLHALKNERFVCSAITNQLLSSQKSSEKNADDHLLTSTEKEILKEISLGKTTKEIAVERHLSFHTVTTHRKNIFRKLGVNNVHEATKYAMRAGLVDLAEYYI